MLLIFFLVTTSMETDKGLQRRIPPQDPDQERQQTDVKADRVLTLSITADGKLLANDSIVNDQQLCDQLAEFIERVGKDHIVEVKASPEANYNSYFHLQNILAKTYNALREQYAQKQYKRPFGQCTEEQRKAIRDRYPQRITEDFS